MTSLSDRQSVRLRIGDVGASLFTNDEIDDFLSKNHSDIWLSASDALLALASDSAKIALAIEMGGWSKDARDVTRELTRVAKEYRKIAEETPEVAVAKGNEPFSSVLGMTS